MVSEVAVVKTTFGIQEAFQKALTLIGGIEDLTNANRDVVIKIGVYDQRLLNHPDLEVTKVVLDTFSSTNQTFLVESDNHMGKGLGRLHLWKKTFSKKTIPFNISEDKNVREADIIGEKINLSHLMYKPNFRVSFHSFRGLRGPDQPLYGSVLKNLLGLIPDTKKERFHEKLSVALVDILEAIGGIDLAILDATYTYFGKYVEGQPFKRVKSDLLIVSRDLIAVDAVGLSLLGQDPLKIDTMIEAKKRGLGEPDLNNIKILGEPIKNLKIKLDTSK
jgi:hypothetical protein